MKTIALLFSLIACSSLFAGPAPVPTTTQDTIIHELESDVSAKFFEVSANPTYAPKLAKQWGGELTIDHPIGQYAFAGVNLMSLNGGYFAGTVGVGAKTSFTVGKLIVTPYVKVGAFKPFTTGNATSGSAADSTNVGASAETGAAVLIWQNADKTVDVSGYGGIKYVTLYPGVQIFGLGLKLGWHF